MRLAIDLMVFSLGILASFAFAEDGQIAITHFLWLRFVICIKLYLKAANNRQGFVGKDILTTVELEKNFDFHASVKKSFGSFEFSLEIMLVDLKREFNLFKFAGVLTGALSFLFFLLFVEKFTLVNQSNHRLCGGWIN